MKPGEGFALMITKGKPGKGPPSKPRGYEEGDEPEAEAEDDEPEADDEPTEEEVAAAEELVAALDSKDAARVASAFRGMMACCSDAMGEEG